MIPQAQLPGYCDNSGAVAPSKNPKNHKGEKYIERKYHLVGEIIQRGDVVITKVASTDNLAKLFTKTLTSSVFQLRVIRWV